MRETTPFLRSYHVYLISSSQLSKGEMEEKLTAQVSEVVSSSLRIVMISYYSLSLENLNELRNNYNCV